MNVLERAGVDRLSFGFDVRHLAADHAANGPCRCADLGDHAHAPCGLDRRARQRRERQRQQAVAGQNRHRLAEHFVVGGLAAPQVVVVERRQVVVNQRIGVDEFERAADLDRTLQILGEHSRHLEAQRGANSLTPRKHAVPHRTVNRRRLRIFRRQYPVQRRFDRGMICFEEIR